MLRGPPNYSPRPGPVILGMPRAPHAQEARRPRAQQLSSPLPSPRPQCSRPHSPAWSPRPVSPWAIWVPSLPRHPAWPLRLPEQSLCFSGPEAASPRRLASSDPPGGRSSSIGCPKQLLWTSVWAQADARPARTCSGTPDALLRPAARPAVHHGGEDALASAPLWSSAGGCELHPAHTAGWGGVLRVRTGVRGHTHTLHGAGWDVSQDGGARGRA